jgi:hypothetical protein
MESSTLCGIHSKSLKLRYTDGHMGHKWQNELAEVTPERGKATTNTDMEAHHQVGGLGGHFCVGAHLIMDPVLVLILNVLQSPTPTPPPVLKAWF